MTLTVVLKWLQIISVIGSFTVFVIIGISIVCVLKGRAYFGAPVQSDSIVCLSSNDKRLEKSAELYRKGYAELILVSFASDKAKLIELGIPDYAIIEKQKHPNSTFEEATYTYQMMQKYSLDSAIVVTDPIHLYRAKWTFEQLIKDRDVSLSFAATEEDDTERESGNLAWLNEIPKVPYYWLVHGLLGNTYDPVWISKVENWYNQMLKRVISRLA